MKDGLYSWWGFRIRVPLDYTPTPATRGESLAFGMILGSAVTAVWVGASVALPDLGWRASVGVPLFVATAAILFGFLPVRLLESSGVAAWMVLSREKGSIGRFDHWLVTTSLVLSGLSLFRIEQPYRVGALCMLLEIAAAGVLLSIQERVASVRRRWSIEIPEWLKGQLEVKEEEQDHKREKDQLIPPQEGAQPVYHFTVGNGQAYPVGVVVGDALIAALRRLNREHRGYLYQREPQAAVLADRFPTENLGREQIETLCAQILSIARKHQLNRLALANAVLAFVQTEIPYGFDHDTTAEFEGGPFDDYGRMPSESLHDSVGDCECTAILCASLLAYLGFEAALLSVVVNQGNHLAVGLLDSVLPPGTTDGLDLVEAKDGGGRRYLYGETALDGCNLPFGAVPADWREGLKIERVEAIGTPRSTPSRVSA